MATLESLATELRQQIFEHLLIHKSRDDHTTGEDYFEYSFDAIDRVNKRFKDEAAAVLNRKQTYHYYIRSDAGAEQHLLLLESRPPLPAVRCVHIHRDHGGENPGVQPTPLALWRRASHLKEWLLQCPEVKEVRYSITEREVDDSITDTWVAPHRSNLTRWDDAWRSLENDGSASGGGW